MSDAIMNFWHSMVNAFQSATALLVIIGGIAVIFGIVFFTMFGLKKKINTNFAIILSTVLSCVLMVPVISSYNNFVKIKIEGSIIDEGRADIRAKRAEAARMLAENKRWILELETLRQRITIGRQSVEMQTLNDTIKVLEHAQLSMQSFQRILQLALLETNLKQTHVWNERIGSVQQGTQFDEVLVIIVFDINAKYGIDLNEVRVAKLNDATVVVSGIKSIFIGADRNIDETILSEIRRVDMQDVVRDVLYDSANVQLANRYADIFKAEFQTRLSNGTELSFMDEAVVQLAQNFLRVMLAPLYRNVIFDNVDRPDALPLMEYLGRELRETNAKILELYETNGNLFLENEQMESVFETIRN